MDFFIAFGLFIVSMLAALLTGHSMIYALLVGLVLFLAVGIRRGFSLKALAHMGWGSIKDSLVVIEVMAIIGFITAAWRVSGTDYHLCILRHEGNHAALFDDHLSALLPSQLRPWGPPSAWRERWASSLWRWQGRRRQPGPRPRGVIMERHLFRR